MTQLESEASRPADSAATDPSNHKAVVALEPDSKLARVVRLVGAHKRVLELGCGAGVRSQAIVANGSSVVGVESDPELAAQASSICERVLVAVVERDEPVFVIEPRHAAEWALFAYHIGNRHQPLMITDRALVCPDVPGVEQLLQQHHMPYVRATRPFTPAAAGAGHQH